MKETLLTFKADAIKELSEAKDKKTVIEIKSKYLGRKGKIAAVIKGLPKLNDEERRLTGKLINEVKSEIEKNIESLINEFEAKEKRKRLESDIADITLPGRRLQIGKRHPITLIAQEVQQIFQGLGFGVAEGPEIETDYYNFEALNIPKDHPARDMQDTFYISEELLLRTHTSPVQIRFMEKHAPPLRVIAPGAVYRRDSDLSHTPMFHQVEGFMVDEGVTFAYLKGVLTYFLRSLFSEDIGIRFRPSFFPFTEPSAEIDIGCLICNGGGCRVCKGSGWLEILGGGMIHPEVFKAVNYDQSIYTGFAFGIGIERIAMLKLGIDDIRLFFENDIRFIRQF